MMRHGRNLFQLYRRFGTLGNVKIHFVAIKRYYPNLSERD
jgi:hypothetical protein